MLIYNYKKEFLGIDESDLMSLGLKDLADLRAESADFADLFVKTPGCIHNFKHVHWIDYVLEATGAEPRAVIHVKDKNFSTNITIKTIYLVDNPNTKAYIIELTNLRPLSASQMEQISSDISSKPTTHGTTESTKLFTTPGSIVHDEHSKQEVQQPTVEFDPYESEDKTTSIPDIYETDITNIDNLAVDEAPLKIDVEDTELEEQISEVSPIETIEDEIIETPEEKTSVKSVNSKFADYVYDPNLASEELGLPVDLIQEFIEDFITQANSFRTELYESAQNADFDRLKIQSHKLKGVAANLRIQDALDALTTINTSDNYDEIKTNLDYLYSIINKLSNNPMSYEEVKTEPEINDSEDDELILSFKNDEPAVQPSPKIEEIIEEIEEENFANDIILDDDVPTSISIPELADDDFLNNETTELSMPTIDEDLVAPEDTTSNKDSYNKEQIAGEFGLDLESFNELYNEFIDESKELSEIISKSAEENNLSVCKSTAIKMKGMCENMRIHELDSELEQIINATTKQDVQSGIDILKSKVLELGDK